MTLPPIAIHTHTTCASATVPACRYPMVGVSKIVGHVLIWSTRPPVDPRLIDLPAVLVAGSYKRLRRAGIIARTYVPAHRIGP